MSLETRDDRSSIGNYVLITPCRDEVRYAERCLRSVIGQTLLPRKWIIVDDGSTDGTSEILRNFARDYPWIEVIPKADRGTRSVGPGVVDAFYHGLDHIRMDDYEFLCKFDLDLDIPSKYFAILVKRMRENPLLGTCSGKAYFESPSGNWISEKCGDEMSIGMTKFFRVSCFNDIGGFVREVMWDGIDCHRCRMRGWIARSWDEPDLRVLHLRPMGSSQKGILTGRMRHGFGQYFMGSSLAFVTASSIFRLLHPPLLIGGLAIWWGYVSSALRRLPRYEDDGFRKFLRYYQSRSLIVGKRKAIAEIDSLASRRRESKIAPNLVVMVALATAFMLSSCANIPIKKGVYDLSGDRGLPPETGLKPNPFFSPMLQTSGTSYASKEKIEDLSKKIDPNYRFGPGDHFSFLVRGREDISLLDVTVSPDGQVSLPRVGIINVNGRTLEDITQQCKKALAVYYDNPEVTIHVTAYNNNRVFVLGRVAKPGLVSFQGPGTLLEALSLAGGLPVDTSNRSFLTRCSISRGKDLVLWIDLKSLLEQGNMSLNARLQNGDVVFIPQSEDQVAYVLGEVRMPGVLMLRSEYTLLDAIAQVGGPTPEANLRDVFLIRRVRSQATPNQGSGKSDKNVIADQQGHFGTTDDFPDKGVVQRINLKELISHGDYRKNYVLKAGDMVYVPETGLARWNYYISQISPTIQMINVAASAGSNLKYIRSGLPAALGVGN